uniref:Uncharacterized protein n=1 Tax=Aegilops tauschii TaxID=37682 RepID=R7W0V0_AEGTA
MGADHNGVSALGLVLAVAAALLACQCAAQVPAPAPAPSGGSGGSGCMPVARQPFPVHGLHVGQRDGARGAVLRGGVRRAAVQPECLCAVLGGTAATLGVALDGARALQMPAACRGQAPPASQCDSMGVPMSSPATPYDPEATPAVGSEVLRSKHLHHGAGKFHHALKGCGLSIRTLASKAFAALPHARIMRAAVHSYMEEKKSCLQ